MNISMMSAAAFPLAIGFTVAGNAMMRGENATKDFGSTSNLLQYGAVIGGGAALGSVAPSIFGKATSTAGGLHGAQLGLAALGGWAVGELLSQKLGI
jgi:hypothetical protein